VTKRHIFEILVMVGLWLAVAFFVYLHVHKPQPAPVPSVLLPTPNAEKGKQYDIKKITVLTGDSFDIALKDGSRVLGKLPVFATSNAKERVLDLLNHSTRPRVVLREKQPDGRWIVEVSFAHDGRDWSLSEWLTANNLVYK
jgi:hypothetical protein